MLVGIVAFLFFIYWESVTSMFSQWRLTSHQHGLLVFPISAYLVWRLLPQLESVRLRSEPWGIVVVAIPVMIWITSRLVGVQVIEHASVLAMIPATVFAVSGKQLTHKILFPLMFLAFAVPIGDSVVPYLVAITADLSSAFLRLSGVPLLRDELLLILPGGSFVVAEVCSGIRYLMSGMMIALVFSYLTYQRSFKRVFFLALAGVLLVLANGLRAYLIMTIASATEMRYLGGADHVYFGWALFGVLMMSIMWVGTRYADEPNDRGSGKSSGKSIGGSLGGPPLVIVLGLAMLAATLNPLQSEAISVGKLLFGLVILVVAVFLAGRQKFATGGERRKWREMSTTRNLRSVSFVAIVAVVLVSGPYSVAVLNETATVHAAVPNIKEIRSCNSRKSWEKSWFPQMRNADIEVAATLFCADGQVSVYVAGYASSVQGKELVSRSNRLTPDWGRYVKTSLYRFSEQDGGSRQLRELVVDAPGHRELVWYWYEIDRHAAIGEFAVKALQVWALLRGRPAGGHVVLLTTPITTNKQEARRRLEAVSADLMNAESQITSSDQT